MEVLAKADGKSRGYQTENQTVAGEAEEINPI